MAPSSVPDIVVGRLPLYLRALAEMERAGQVITSSQELGSRLGISSAQIRKDLSQFGEFGKQGTGYQIPFLAQQLRRILKLERIWDIALVGAGDLGNAVANYAGFKHRGFGIALVYDSEPDKIGKKAGSFVIRDSAKMVDEIKSRGIALAMIAVPAREAQAVADQLVEAGVRAILNYAPTSISVPENVHVQQSDPVLLLQHMTYYLT